MLKSTAAPATVNGELSPTATGLFVWEGWK